MRREDLTVIVRLKTLTLKRILARKNLSYNSFARRAHISGPYMSQLMTRKRLPSPEVRSRIMSALNATQKLDGLPLYQFDDLFILEGR